MPRLTPVHWRDLERVFLAVGFAHARQEGSHRSYVKQGISRPVVIPIYAEVPAAGISRDQYFALLGKS